VYNKEAACLLQACTDLTRTQKLWAISNSMRQQGQIQPVAHWGRTNT